MQDQQGDVATLVEETAGGIRVIKAFGRRDHMAHTFDGRAQQLLRHRRGQGAHGRHHLATVRPGPEHHARHQPRRRRRRGLARPDHPRRTGRVRLAAADADLADRRAGLHHRQRAGGDDRRRPHLRGARHRNHPSWTGQARSTSTRPRYGERCGSRAYGSLPRRARARPARGRSRGPAGRDARHRGRHRVRQDHARLAGAPPDRRHRRPDHARRPRHPRRHPRARCARSSASPSRRRRCSR